MFEDMVLTHDECVQENHKVGLKYLELSKRFKAVAEKYRANIDDPVGLHWEFDKLYEINMDISRRMKLISDRLIAI